MIYQFKHLQNILLGTTFWHFPTGSTNGIRSTGATTIEADHQPKQTNDRPPAPPVARRVNNPQPGASFRHHFPINPAGQLTSLTLSNLSDRWTLCGRSEVGANAKPAEPTPILLFPFPAAVSPNPAPSPPESGAESSRELELSYGQLVASRR
ncbi:hypothetical protein VPH35_010047 [Triticum aestivum]